MAQERYETFTEVFQEVHGQDAEPTPKPLDLEMLIIAGEGRGHGRHLLCNGAITTSSHRKLHEIHASSTSSTPSIRSRPTVVSREITRLKALMQSQGSGNDAPPPPPPPPPLQELNPLEMIFLKMVVTKSYQNSRVLSVKIKPYI
ncbi:putative serine/threonine-protein kinase receptor [Hordeum vulgare]|nr:putative serine/threonine-protein kinase receptor [Hordeum vulgare]